MFNKFRRILLIIIIIFYVFQMVVLATAIDIGYPANDLSTLHGTGYTMILRENPADGTGTITSIDIWANQELANCDVATFFAVDATHYTTRDYETVNNGNGAGVVIAGSKQTFTVNLDVVTGDLIGIYFSAGYIEAVVTSPGHWVNGGDLIPCSNQIFYDDSSWFGIHLNFSLYGTGATEEEETYNFFGYNSN